MSLTIERDAPLRALLWDLDGTLIDSSSIHRLAYARVLKDLAMTPVPYERVAGRPTREVFADLGLTGSQLEKTVRQKQELARQALGESSVLFDGADEVLRAGREYGLATALVSGASRESVQAAVRRHRLDRFVDVVISAGDTDRAKPYPDPFLEACRRLDVFPAEALAIEDSECGIRSAKAAGIPVYAVHAEEALATAEGVALGDLIQLGRELPEMVARSDKRSPVHFFNRVRPLPRAGRCVAIVPAAGRGTRLGSSAPKLLFEIDNETVLAHLCRQLLKTVDAIVLVVSPDGHEPIRECAERLGLHVDFAIQPEPVGMADAVCRARHAPAAVDADSYLIVWGDQVTLRAATVERLMTVHEQAGVDVSLPTHLVTDPYIHFVRRASGRLAGVLQRREGDAMPPVGENDCGVFLVRNRAFFDRLEGYLESPSELGPRTGEVNFLPFLVNAVSGIERVCCLRGIDCRETLGVNSPADAELAGRYLREFVN